jgi:hypothetical protein
MSEEKEQLLIKLEQYPELRDYVNQTILAVTDGIQDANESSPLMKYTGKCDSIQFDLPKVIVGSNGIIINTSFTVLLEQK